MKKLVLCLMILGSLSAFSAESVVIDKEVTGVNKETIETREVADKKINLSIITPVPRTDISSMKYIKNPPFFIQYIFVKPPVVNL